MSPWQRAGVSRQAAAKAAREGRLALHPDGSIDPDGELTQTWLRRDRPHARSRSSREPRRGSLSGHEHDPTAQIRALAAKAALQEEWCARMEARHYDREWLALAWKAETVRLMTRLMTIPQRYAAWLAKALGLSEEAAGDILATVTTELLAELEGFPDAAEATVMRLP